MSEARVTVLHTRIVSGTGGGPEKTILNSPRFLEGTRWREAALYLHAPLDPGIEVLRERAKARRCPFHTLADKYPFDPRTLKQCADLCRELGVVIWHGHDYKSNLFGVLLRKRCDLRLFTTVHGWVKYTRKTPLYFAVDRWSIRRYEEVVCVSQDLFDECARFGVSKEKLTLVENAIDTDEFRRAGAPSASPLRASMPAGRLLVGAVGRLSEEKGFHHLITAVERAIERGLELELWIAGEGDQKPRLEAQIAASRHAARMKLLGFQKDALQLFEALDVFALSSLREGLPNVVLEAMAMEVPVLATRCGGMEAFAEDGEDALLVGTDSADELERGLARLAEDAALRQRLATTARAKIERDYSFARRMQRFAALYERMLARPR
ncbi:MAG: glycosyltransferase family 4 protein [Planctomycetes bacterium]|nr:glycosyltransferase family 4 protein [Planctomycetota bacterium]